MTVALAAMTAEPLDPAALEHAVTAPTHGAVVVFSGLVRDHDHGHIVSGLDYSAHPRAERFLREICEDAVNNTEAPGGVSVAAAHRVGTLSVGEIAVVVAVAAAHRADAFTTCATLMERIKHEVPIWKRQHFADGASEWVGICG